MGLCLAFRGYSLIWDLVHKYITHNFRHTSNKWLSQSHWIFPFFSYLLTILNSSVSVSLWPFSFSASTILGFLYHLPSGWDSICPSALDLSIYFSVCTQAFCSTSWFPIHSSYCFWSSNDMALPFQSLFIITASISRSVYWALISGLCPLSSYIWLLF